jgi:hypothetical protein
MNNSKVSKYQLLNLIRDYNKNVDNKSDKIKKYSTLKTNDLLLLCQEKNIVIPSDPSPPVKYDLVPEKTQV